MASKSTTPDELIEPIARSVLHSFERGKSVSFQYDSRLIARIFELLKFEYKLYFVDSTIKESKLITLTPKGQFAKYD